MFALFVRAITGIHARWIGVDPVDADGAVPQRVYFANHASNLDAPVIWSSLPRPLRKKTRPIAARDYWTRGPVRRFLALKVLNAVLIEADEGDEVESPARADGGRARRRRLR